MTMELDHVVAHRHVDHSRVAAPSHRSVNHSRAPAPSHRSVDNSRRIDTKTRTKPDAVGQNKNWSKQGKSPSEESPVGISCIPPGMSSHECAEIARKQLAELQ